MALLAKAYLTLYNLTQLAGWSYIALKALQATPECLEKNDFSQIWRAVRQPMLIFQTFMLMEVVHAFLGIVRSSALNNLLQIASRVFIVHAVYVLVLDKATQPWITIAALLITYAWTITELVRYKFYLLALYDISFYPLTWSRYTFFFILYPMGVTGEVLSIWSAIRILKGLPNLDNWTLKYENLAIDYVTFLYCLLPMYGIFFPKLYFHMIGLRKKVIGGGRVSSDSKTKRKAKKSN